MKIRETEFGIRRGLEVLSRRPYLAAMWILCDELRSLYAEWISDADRAIMESTMNLVRDAVVSGESAAIAGRAKQVASDWDLLASKHDDKVPIGPANTLVGVGLRNTWEVFWYLALELAGIAPPYHAADWVTNPIEERWRVLKSGPGRRRPIHFDPQEEVDDDSPWAHTLERFYRAVAKAGEAQDRECDPVRLQAEIRAEADSRSNGVDEDG